MVKDGTGERKYSLMCSSVLLDHSSSCIYYRIWMCIISREIVERVEEEIWWQLICMTKLRVHCLQSCLRLEPVGFINRKRRKAASLLPLNPLQFRTSALSSSCCCAPTIAHMTSVPIILSPENASKTACVLFFVFFKSIDLEVIVGISRRPPGCGTQRSVGTTTRTR